MRGIIFNRSSWLFRDCCLQSWWWSGENSAGRISNICPNDPHICPHKFSKPVLTLVQTANSIRFATTSVIYYKLYSLNEFIKSKNIFFLRNVPVLFCVTRLTRFYNNSLNNYQQTRLKADRIKRNLNQYKIWTSKSNGYPPQKCLLAEEVFRNLRRYDAHTTIRSDDGNSATEMPTNDWLLMLVNLWGIT